MRNFKAPPLTAGADAEIQRAKSWLSRNQLPLSVEVGCGAGYHPLLFVRDNPTKRILAFERTTVKFEKAKHRLESHLAKSTEYERCLIVHGDATHLWANLISPLSLDTIYFLYPNPYPKNQHANRRLARMPFFATALESLKLGGRVVFSTNEKLYFEELLEHMRQLNYLKVDKVGGLAADQKPRSHFEKKYLERGETCYEIIAEKIISEV